MGLILKRNLYIRYIPIYIYIYKKIRAPQRGKIRSSLFGHRPRPKAAAEGSGRRPRLGRRRNSPGRGRNSPGRRRNSPGRGRNSPGRRRNFPPKDESSLLLLEFAPSRRQGPSFKARLELSSKARFESMRVSTILSNVFDFLVFENKICYRKYGWGVLFGIEIEMIWIDSLSIFDPFWNGLKEISGFRSIPMYIFV